MSLSEAIALKKMEIKVLQCRRNSASERMKLDEIMIAEHENAIQELTAEKDKWEAEYREYDSQCREAEIELDIIQEGVGAKEMPV